METCTVHRHRLFSFNDDNADGDDEDEDDDDSIAAAHTIGIDSIGLNFNNNFDILIQSSKFDEFGHMSAYECS